MDRSATYDFLLVIHSAHGYISYRFGDKFRKSWIFSFPHNTGRIQRPAVGVLDILKRR